MSHLKALYGDDGHAREPVSRTENFEDRPVPPGIPEDAKAPVRDDRLAIVEDLVPGPVEHKPIDDDPNFDRIEPNSGIRLKCVLVPLEFAFFSLTVVYYPVMVIPDIAY